MPRSFASVMKKQKRKDHLKSLKVPRVRRVKSAKGVPVSLAVVEDSLRSKGSIQLRRKSCRKVMRQ